MAPLYHVEPLGTAHDRATFSCGVEALDRYLKQQAGQDLRRRIAGVFVACRAGTSTVVGYYTLSATSIEAGELPEALIRKLPRYPVLPAALLGRLAVDTRLQGQGVGALLLQDALARAYRSEVVAMAVVVDAKDEAAARFYERYGFQRFVHQPMRLFVAMSDIARLLGDQP